MSIRGAALGLFVSLASLGANACGGDSVSHGTIDIRLKARPGLENLFAGTKRIEVEVAYGNCILDFYRNNPEWKQCEDGAGADEFASWTEQLCDGSDVDTRITCAVSKIDQLEDLQGDASRIRVTYTVPAGQPVELRDLTVGPFPSGGIGCDPQVVVAPKGIKGYTNDLAGGSRAWQGSSVEGTSTASVGQPAVTRVIAIR